MIGLALAVLTLAGAVYYRWPPHAPGSGATPDAALPSAERPAAPAPAAGAVRPSFDIVRITPDGHVVIAGRAEPGSAVIVRYGDVTLGEAHVDRNGEFVMAPEATLPPGNRELSLAERGRDGTEIKAAEVVMVLKWAKDAAPASASPASPLAKPDGERAEPSPAPAAPTALLLPSDASPPRLLQAPSPPGRLALNSVDYGEQGDIRFAGSAKPAASIRIYVDNKPVGETKADAAGQWSLVPPQGVEPGLHRLRVDQLGGGGSVQSRVEVPFQRTAIPAGSGLALGQTPGQAIVQPGQNLWRIARHSYGAGTRYTVIYLANREQIRDPNRIYPGQVFAMPAAAP